MINNLIIIWLLLPYFTYCTERLSSPLWRHGDFKNPEIALGTRLNWIWKNCRCSLAFSKIQTFNLSYEYGKTWKYTHSKTNISESKFWMGCSRKNLNRGVEDMEYPVVLKKGIEKCQSIKKCSRISGIVQEKVLLIMGFPWILVFNLGISKGCQKILEIFGSEIIWRASFNS